MSGQYNTEMQKKVFSFDADMEACFVEHKLKIPVQVHKHKHIALALSFDGTKVLASLLLSTGYNAIAGGVCPNHFISVAEMDEGMI